MVKVSHTLVELAHLLVARLGSLIGECKQVGFITVRQMVRRTNAG